MKSAVGTTNMCTKPPMFEIVYVYLCEFLHVLCNLHAEFHFCRIKNVRFVIVGEVSRSETRNRCDVKHSVSAFFGLFFKRIFWASQLDSWHETRRKIGAICNLRDMADVVWSSFFPRFSRVHEHSRQITLFWRHMYWLNQTKFNIRKC